MSLHPSSDLDNVVNNTVIIIISKIFIYWHGIILKNERNYNRKKMDHKFLYNLKHIADDFFIMTETLVP
jgi:hypothetical protein